MNNTNKELGQMISEVRQLRGLTQAELAIKLNTSQSAVNRMEKGGQNLSLEMLGRISEVLKKPLISVGSQGINLSVHGGRELSGKITLKNSKNAAVGLLCASILNRGKTTFRQFPRIEEVFRIIEVLESIGVRITWENGNDLIIKRPAKLKIENLNTKAARKTRSVIMLVGALMHELTEFNVPYAGGCKLGERTVKPHLYALEDFGVNIVAKDRFYHVTVDKKQPKEVTLYESGDTVTENAVMAAAVGNSPVTIHYASGNYMVQDVLGFLVKLGVVIKGIGTSVITITGTDKPVSMDVEYSLAEDPIEAMFFVSTALTTNSEITINRVPIDFMRLELLKLEKMGASFTRSSEYLAKNGFTKLIDLVVHKHNGSLKALEEKLHANVYPVGINQDNLPYFVPICTQAKGTTLIHDWTYENRAIYYTELTKIGAEVELADPHRVYVRGKTTFSSADLACPPALRPASLLLIGMLAAKGQSMLRNVYTINRGYEDLAARLNSLGAEIEVIHSI